MRAVLISTYDLGRQPFGLASPAAWLRNAGIDVCCVDTSRTELRDDHISEATLVAFHLPMHTATRLAAPLIERTRRVNPDARVAAYGLYAPLNETWLRERGVQHVLGPEAEGDLVAIVTSPSSPEARGPSSEPRVPRLAFIQPDRSTLPALASYAALHMPDGSRRIVGATDATRGCKHLCRHCPIVPVYRGAFRVVPVDVVMADVSAQVAAGAEHITFGDPDFFNGPTHARRIVEQLARDHPGVTYDVTIKIEHLLAHRELLPLLHDTGCVFITSAVESVDDDVLARLRKGHTRADFVRAVELCRAAAVALAPTFVPFTPWTTLPRYLDLLDAIESLDLVSEVAPIQLAIRLLVTADSLLLELDDIQAVIGAFDRDSLTYPWRHADPRVDRLQQDVMRIVSITAGGSRSETFGAIVDRARQVAGVAPSTPRSRSLRPVPFMTEPWYCCAEPMPVDL